MERAVVWVCLTNNTKAPGLPVGLQAEKFVVTTHYPSVKLSRFTDGFVALNPLDWDEAYLDKAFFYQREQLFEYTLLLAAQALAGQGYGQLLFVGDGQELAHYAWPQAYSAGAVTEYFTEKAVQTIPLAAQVRSLTQWRAATCLTNGVNLMPFVSWCLGHLERDYREGKSDITDVAHGAAAASAESQFVYTWRSFAPVMGLALAAKPLPAAVRQDEQGAYSFAVFEDGTAIPDILRPYYACNYRLREMCGRNPFDKLALFAQTTILPGDDEPVPYTAMADCIWQERPDLQVAFPVPQAEGRMGYMQWFTDNVRAEYTLDDVFVQPVKQAIDTAATPAPVQKGLFKRKKQSPAANKPQYPQGVNLCGHIRGEYGIGEATRMVAAALDGADIPYGVVDFASEGNYRYTNREYAGRITNRFDYNTNIMYTNADGLAPFLQSVAPAAIKGRYNIGYWAWEMPEFPRECCSAFGPLDEVWALSDFTAQSIAAVSPIPVRSIPHPVVVVPPAPGCTRQNFALPEKDFLYLMMYDVRSVPQRKNPQGALDAFVRAFGGTTGVGLVIKVNMPEHMRGHDPFLKRAASYPNVYIIDRHLSRAELSALMEQCNAYLSLHRSEGFGFGPAEAMLLGKPAVLTNWSGNTQYMQPGACCPVEYTLIELDKDYGPYRKGWHWAEPDIDSAAGYMRRLVEDTQYYKKIAVNGQNIIRMEFSPKAQGKKIKDRMQEIGLL